MADETNRDACDCGVATVHGRPVCGNAGCLAVYTVAVLEAEKPIAEKARLAAQKKALAAKAKAQKARR